MNDFLSLIASQSAPVKTLDSGLHRLREIRSSLYENLNQIQHELLILEGLIWLTQSGSIPDKTEWFWNPRQTGTFEEPDLVGICDDVPVVSAEATTSEKPVGVIDSRMRDTLRKLDCMEGKKYYFVRTDAMANRARTKITKEGLNIVVAKIGR